eukprot:Hpha_TRINITY_DN15277_c0_g1::TRINITY_DN15277_c0_g1_i1::g.67243::m.67243/K02927/RP-L40e, RPL40; large subunit ribosomal protein L40e
MGCLPSKSKPTFHEHHHTFQHDAPLPVVYRAAPVEYRPPARDFGASKIPPALPVQAQGPSIVITVQFVTGKRLRVTISAEASVVELKGELERMSQVPAAQQRLVYAGRQMDDVRRLSHYSIPTGATLHLAVRQPKGCLRPDLQELLDMYEITLAQSEDLKVLAMYDIVFLVDDSGSMNRVEVTAGVKQSRW